MALVFLMTGSNRGSRDHALKKAEAGIQARIGQILHESSVVESEPWGFQDEIPFLNQVLAVNTSLSPDLVLREIHEIEKSMGRTRNSAGYQSRNIDIDILLFNDLVIISEDLTIPHPRMAERRFVLTPLAEIAGEYFHPVFHKTIAELLVNCTDNSWVVRYPTDPAIKGL